MIRRRRHRPEGRGACAGADRGAAGSGTLCDSCGDRMEMEYEKNTYGNSSAHLLR